ncbi:MFS transporter [Acidithrix ferrooxidans]|uniref:Major facilitator superfamily protein n=1 Tax=Acidithrix ferrooxidans TaxID=1280514 RepID=A0A0D8HJ43_9ACTN|nr:MFS transporter [Acidithrix ferrooxidans]KJF17874.1 major facilitator superfamily protein [Acidithrix ferrooxidans]
MSRKVVLSDEFELSKEEFEAILTPRRGLVAELEQGYGYFVGDSGLAIDYERRLEVAIEAESDLYRVRQKVSYRVSLLGFGSLVARSIRKPLRSKNPDIKMPIWLPPDPIDADVAKGLIRLLFISITVAYFATLLGQTLTFSAKEFASSVRVQASILFFSRFDIVFGFAFLLFVPRAGRIRVIRIALVVGTIFTVASALSPSILWLGVFQVLAKGTTAAIAVLITILASEAVAKRQRAWALALLIIGTAIGAGLCDLLLPIAGISNYSWRVLYLISLPLGIFGVAVSYSIADRYFNRVASSSDEVVVRPRASMSRSKLILASVAAFLTNFYLIPTTQFRNEYLRTQRHFSASAIGLFVVLTNIPGSIGLAIGGRLAETKGRRIVASAAIVIGGGGLALGFVSSGIGLWVWTILGSALVTAVVPSLGVYQTELFSPASRSLGGGIVTVASRVGSVLGIAFVGYFATSISIGTSVALLFFGMVLLVPILFLFFPETKGLVLDEITQND